MGDRCDPDEVAVNSVYDSIVTDDEFPYASILILRHDSSKSGKCLQSIEG